MPTCKQFLQELSDYLDDTLDPETKAELKRHVAECPNCWVVCDTTEKTIRVFRGAEASPVPADIRSRLFKAIEDRKKTHGPCGGAHKPQN